MCRRLLNPNTIGKNQEKKISYVSFTIAQTTPTGCIHGGGGEGIVTKSENRLPKFRLRRSIQSFRRCSIDDDCDNRSEVATWVTG